MDIEGAVRAVADKVAADAREIEAAADAKEEGLDPGPVGIAVALADGRLFEGGETGTRFPIQSISKVFALELALDAIGDDLFKRVGREPSGDPFNSILDLEQNDGVPRNPFINAGALIVVDILVEELGDDREASAIVDLIGRQLGDDGRIEMDEDVLASEHEAGDLNRAMLSFMRHHGNLRSEADDVMEAYVHQCAITLDCGQLARSGRFLCRTERVGAADDDEAARRMRRLLALMMTCGNYDGSGDFAWRIGLPAKSGVGGGILAVVPGVATIAAWSPNLDQHGNSILGVRAIEMLAEKLDWSVFRPAAG